MLHLSSLEGPPPLRSACLDLRGGGGLDALYPSKLGGIEQLYGVLLVDNLQDPAVGLDHLLPERGEVSEATCYWDLWPEAERVCA